MRKFNICFTFLGLTGKQWGDAGVKAAPVLGGTIGGLLSNGMTTGVGSTLQGLSSVAGMIPGPVGAIASTGLNVIGGAINGLFGSKLNNGFINSKEAEINDVAQQTSTAATTDQFLADQSSMQGVQAFSKSDVGTDGLFSHKAQDEYERLQSNAKLANETAQNNMYNAGNNVNLGNQFTSLRNWQGAKGGCLNTALNAKIFCTGGLLFDNGGKLKPLKQIKQEIDNTKPKYVKGNVYDIDEEEYQKLLDLGYKIKILD